MDPFVLLILAAIVAVFGIGIGVAARRGAGDRPEDRGPYSSSSEATGTSAAFGTTIRRDGPDGEGGGDGGGDGD